MSDPADPSKPIENPKPAATSVDLPPAKEDKEKKKQVIIRMWPKTPILYPMGVMALICGIITAIWGGYPPTADDAAFNSAGNAQYAHAQADSDGAEPTEPEAQPETPEEAPEGETGNVDEPKEEERPGKGVSRLDRILGLLFLGTMFISLFTICVNLDIRWGLIFISSVVIFVLVGVIANLYVDFITNFFGFLNYFYPAGNAQFYFGIFAVWGILMVISWVVSRFHYVKIEPNEVVVVGGMLERQQRYSTMRMRYTKEVQDVLEYYLPLVKSGRLILSFPEQNEAVIIDNVINIQEVTRDLDGLISSLQIISD